MEQKRHKGGYCDDMKTFIEQCDHIFDIKGDVDRIKSQETLWKVKMTPNDGHFYSGMFQVPQVGYCSSFVDRGVGNPTY